MQSWLVLALSTVLVPVAATGACVPVSGDRILGRDLALVDPRFAGLPDSLVVGYTPAPGSKRVFAPTELARIARSQNLSVADLQELCFELPVRSLSNEEFVSSMAKAFSPNVKIQLLERSMVPAPSGELLFPVGSLEPPSAAIGGAQIWRGYVQYGGSRRFPVWARVVVSESVSAVVAARDMAANVPADAGSLRVEVWTGPPQRERVAVRIQDVQGKVLSRPVKAGALIPIGIIVEPPSVRRGDSVRVVVVCGPAQLSLDAVAERDGRSGEMIYLRNPSSGRSFRAKLEGSHAIVVLGSGDSL